MIYQEILIVELRGNLSKKSTLSKNRLSKNFRLEFEMPVQQSCLVNLVGIFIVFGMNQNLKYMTPLYGNTAAWIRSITKLHHFSIAILD